MGSSIKNKNTRELKQWLIAITLMTVFYFGYINNSFAIAGDELLVNESLVNVRSGPSGEAEPLFRLKGGRIVIEIRRENNWIEVETNHEAHPTGWIHKTLLSKINVLENTSSPTRFDNFIQRFNEYNVSINNENGIIYFTEVREKNKKEIEVIATQAWISSTSETKNNSLSEIFKMWSDVVPVGSSISVHVLDEHGERYTVMLR
jgi:Bacterial SH3 domain